MTCGGGRLMDTAVYAVLKSPCVKAPGMERGMSRRQQSEAASEVSASSSLLYEVRPRIDLWLKTIIAGVLAMTLAVGVWLLWVDAVGAGVVLGVTLFDGLLFRAIIPRRYQVYDDRLKIVLGWPFAMNIPLRNIVEAKPAPGHKAWVYWGLRLATSTRGVVEVVRRRGLDMVISPADRDAFLYWLGHALDTVRDSG